MELVRAAALTGYFPVAGELQLETLPLLRRNGLSRSMLNNPEQMLPARSVIRLLEESAAASGCLTFGLRMAELRGIADLGMVSLLIAHQTTLGDALSVLTQFRNRINTNLALRIEQYDELVMLRENFVFDPPMQSRQADDLALGVLEQMCRAVLGSSWKPIAICLPYDRPALEELRVFQRMFSSPVEFNAEFEGILLNRSDLDLPNPRSDPALAEHARNLVNAIIDPGERSVVQEVEQAIQILLPSGRASIGSVADSLGMTVRTLQRRLDEDGEQFSELLDRVRVRETNRHLSQRRLRLTDIADQLGYSSLSAFSNWYRGRFNESPSEARRRLRQRA
ncbi:MAG TPA: AraC family transcriptional regulator [Sphingomicrobium sp.]|nr:AraC family transcriptional regulator [Sphingomicrobium sp.]